MLACTHVAIGKDYAGAGDYYDSCITDIFIQFSDLGIEPVLLREYNCIPNRPNAAKRIHTHELSKSVLVSPAGFREEEESAEIHPSI